MAEEPDKAEPVGVNVDSESPTRLRSRQYLFVGSQTQSNSRPSASSPRSSGLRPPPPVGAILQYDGTSGRFVGVFAEGGGIADPLGLAIGPDGNLYVANGNSNNVLRFNGITGAPIGPFASGGGLDGPYNIVFGPDNNLYVSSSGTNAILKYDGTTGSYIGLIATGGGLNVPRGLVFGSNDNLYVVNYNDASVLRFHDHKGRLTGPVPFVPSGSGGLQTPSDLAFGPDGNLYVPGGPLGPNAGVYRYDGITGAFINLFASVYDAHAGAYPIDLVFGPDRNLYVTVQGGMNGVLRFNGATGAFMDQFIPDGLGGLGNPVGLTFLL